MSGKAEIVADVEVYSCAVELEETKANARQRANLQ